MDISTSFTLTSDVRRSNHPLLPNNLRALIVGKSSSGKTTVVLNLLLREGWLDYENLFVFGKSLFQDEYKLLKECIEAGLSKKDTRNCFEEGIVELRDQRCRVSFLLKHRMFPTPANWILRRIYSYLTIVFLVHRQNQKVITQEGDIQIVTVFTSPRITSKFRGRPLEKTAIF